MVASNHTARPVHSRIFNLTPAGSRLAQYLEYVEKVPQVASDLHFGEIGYPPEKPDPVPSEHFDDDRPQPVDQGREGRLDALYEKLDEQLRGLKLPDLSDEEFYEYRRAVQEIRARIADLENEGE